MSFLIFWKLFFLDPPPFHIQQDKQIDIMFCITNSTLMDRTYPNALAYIKTEGQIRVKQMLWAVKVWAKMIWKKRVPLISLWFLILYQSDEWIQRIFEEPKVCKVENNGWFGTDDYTIENIRFIRREQQFIRDTITITTVFWSFIHVNCKSV